MGRVIRADLRAVAPSARREEEGGRAELEELLVVGAVTQRVGGGSLEARHVEVGRDDKRRVVAPPAAHRGVGIAQRVVGRDREEREQARLIEGAEGVADGGQRRRAAVGGAVELQHDLPLGALACLAADGGEDVREGGVVARAAVERVREVGGDGRRVARRRAHLRRQDHVSRRHDDRAVLVDGRLIEHHDGAVAGVVDVDVERGAVRAPPPRVRVAERRREVEEAVDEVAPAAERAARAVRRPIEAERDRVVRGEEGVEVVIVLDGRAHERRRLGQLAEVADEAHGRCRVRQQAGRLKLEVGRAARRVAQLDGVRAHRRVHARGALQDGPRAARVVDLDDERGGVVPRADVALAERRREGEEPIDGLLGADLAELEADGRRRQVHLPVGDEAVRSGQKRAEAVRSGQKRSEAGRSGQKRAAGRSGQKRAEAGRSGQKRAEAGRSGQK